MIWQEMKALKASFDSQLSGVRSDLSEVRSELKTTREELSARIDQTNERLDQTNERLDQTNADLKDLKRFAVESEMRRATATAEETVPRDERDSFVKTKVTTCARCDEPRVSGAV